MESKHAYYNNVPTLYYYLFDIKKREVGTYLGFLDRHLGWRSLDPTKKFLNIS